MNRFLKRFLSVGAGLAVLWVAPAFAIEGNDAVHDLETPYTLPRTTVLGQARLVAQPSWTSFLQEAGRWDVTFDEATGTVRQASGVGLPLLSPAVTDPARFETASLAFIRDHRALLGTTPERLQVFHNRRFEDGHTFVLFQQMYEGVPVKDAVVQLQFVDGALVRFKSTAHEIQSVPAATLSADAALQIAWDAVSSVHPVDVYTQPTRIVFVQETATGYAYRPAWQMEIDTASPIARFETVIDAVDGSVLSRRNHIYNASIQLRGEVEKRTVNDPKVMVGLPHSRSGSDVTNADGMAETTSGSFTANLNGPAFVINDQAQTEATKTFTLLTGSDLQQLNWSSSDAPIEELDAWYYALRIHAEHEFVTPSLTFLDVQLPVNININQTCNAFFDGSSLNFFVAGSGCNNTARIFDVVAHEWGHGLHFYHSPQGINAPEIQEGVADFIAAGVTGDANIGPNFLTNGSPVRNIEVNRVYPQDFTGEVHDDGLVWGGAWWDLRKALIVKYGPARGGYLASKLHSDTIRSAPDITTAYADTIAANDDDGNPNNGTPDSCEINEAFDQHGMITTARQPEEGYLRYVHTPPAVLLDAGDVELRAGVFGEGCGSGVDNASIKVQYSTDNGVTFQEAPMSLDTNGEFTTTLKGLPAGTSVQYYIEGKTDDAGTSRTWTWPRSAPKSFLGFYVGGVNEVQTWDFEDGGTGWTSTTSGSAITDDWEIGTPAGNAWDPTMAYQGSNIAGNDIGLRGGDGFYPNGIANSLISPVVDCSGCSHTRLQFMRWVNTAPNDTVRVKVNDTVVWEDVTGDIHDDVWAFEDIDISAVADGNKSLQITFELASNFNDSWGGWNIDNVAVVQQAAGSGGGGNGPANALNGGCTCALTSRAASGPQAATGLLALLGALVALRRRRRS